MRKRSGFTIVELLVVIAIIGVLAGMLLPAINRVRQTAKETDCKNNIRGVGQALLQYTTAHQGRFPAYFQAAADDFGNTNFVGSWVEKLQMADTKGITEFVSKSLVCTTQPELGRSFAASPTAANFQTGSEGFPYAYNCMIGNCGNGGVGSLLDQGKGVKMGMIENPNQTVLMYEASHNLGAFSSGSGTAVNWRARKPTSPVPGDFATLQTGVQNLVSELSGNPSLYFRHSNNSRMNVMFVDGSVRSVSLEEIVSENDTFQSAGATFQGQGTIWDNLKSQ